jgi:hypothetical protein
MRISLYKSIQMYMNVHIAFLVSFPKMERSQYNIKKSFNYNIYNDTINDGYKMRMCISCYLKFCDTLLMKSINLDLNFVTSKV